MAGKSYIAADDAPAKKKILASALKLFVEQGVGATTVRDITDAAGYTNPALFKHFDSKDALARYLFESCYLALFDTLSRAMSGHDRFKSRQRAVVEAFVRALHEDGAAVLFALENLRTFFPGLGSAARKKSLPGLISSLLNEGRREKRVTNAVDQEILLVAWLGILQHFTREWYFGGYRKKEAKIAAELNAVIMNALGA